MRSFFTDSQLLDPLVAEKLAVEADRIRAENWGWVEVMTEIDYGCLSQFLRIPPTEVELSRKEKARQHRIYERHETLIEGLEDDAPDEVIAELECLTAEIETLFRKKQQWSEEDKSRSGAIIGLDYHGRICITRGFAREERSDARTQSKVEKKNGMDSDDGPPTSSGAVSEPLLVDLTAHGTAALRAVLARKASTALRALAHKALRLIPLMMRNAVT